MDLKELAEIAAARMKEHRLDGWTFRLTNAKRRLGVCNFRTKRIEIAAYYASKNSVESVLDTLGHEIAHALAGHAAGHGPIWKAIAIRLGVTPKACDNSPETQIEPGDWQAACPTCRRVHHRYRQPPTLTGYRCRCPDRSALTFEYRGAGPQPPELQQRLPSANWHATCAGCSAVYRRVRRPKAGLIWRCRCPARCDLTWRFLG